MRFIAVLASLGIQSLTLALAAPSAAPSQAESIANATALGVDVHGPIPEDATKLSEGYYSAEPGSKAWAWIRAQIDLEPVPKHDKRQQYQNANIGIGMYAGDLCTGQAVWVDNTVYGYNYYTPMNMYSVGLGYRSLRSNERLDFSRNNGLAYCGNYVYSATINTATGCFNSQLINCFLLSVL